MQDVWWRPQFVVREKQDHITPIISEIDSCNVVFRKLNNLANAEIIFKHLEEIQNQKSLTKVLIYL